jgi:hypothetical protein
MVPANSLCAQLTKPLTLEVLPTHPKLISDIGTSTLAAVLLRNRPDICSTQKRQALGPSLVSPDYSILLDTFQLSETFLPLHHFLGLSGLSGPYI